MAARYNRIQPLAFRFAETRPGITVQYDQVILPGSYKQDLLSAYQRTYQKAKSLPIKSLNNLVRLLVPDLYTIDSFAGKAGDQSWLRIDPGTVAPDAIRILLGEWSAVNGMETVPVPPQSAFLWRRESLNLTDWDTNDNGTAKAVDGAVYDLLPTFLAKDIEGLPIDLGGANPLTFYRVAKAAGARGHEMISWPPLYHINKAGCWYYSYFLHITVATIPFDGQPVVNIRPGIRRWASARHHLPKNEDISIYLRAGVSYIPGVNSPHSFQVAPARLIWSSKEPRLEWADKLTYMLRNVGFPEDIPSPQMLWQDPTTTLTRAQLPNMAMVYSTRMSKPTHPVNPGVTPFDRARLLEILADRWAQWLKVAEPLPEVKVSTSRNERAFSNANLKEPTAKRWARLKQQHRGGGIRIEIYFQREASRRAMLDQLGALLDIDAEVGEYQRDQVTITVTTQPLGELGAALRRTYKSDYQQVLDERREKLLAAFGRAQATTVALIELGNKDAFADVRSVDGKQQLSTDPKNAIRYAFAHSGRLTQFFTPMTDDEIKDYQDQTPKSAVRERLKNAALDGLRQLGVHEGGEALEGHRLRLNPWGYAVAGFWLVRKSRKKSLSGDQQFLPALVYVDGEDGKVLAWVAGMEEMRPYHEVLLRAGCGNIEVNMKHEVIAKRLRQDLENALMGSGDVILVVDAVQASMRSKVWRWLQDSEIVRDQATFADNRTWLPEDVKGLRIVRVRSETGEIPTWYAGDNTKAGISKGLWRVNDRVFGSTTGTPSTQKFNRGLTKTDTSKAVENTPNPVFYELTTAFIELGDDPAEIASMVHSLREASIQSRDETAHPLPLHLAKRIEEYLLLVDDDSDSSDSDEAEDGE